MTVEEEHRHRLYDRAVDVLGEEPASTLMRYLPPIEAAEFARRADLEELREQLREELRSEIRSLGDRLDRRIERVEDRLDHQTRTFVITSIGSLATLGALAFAAASLI